MIGCVPVQVPALAVSVWPSCAVPEIVGSTVLTGGEAVVPPFSTLTVSATRLNAWAAVSLPIWIVETPAVPRLAAESR